jgi:hypothetical protein
MIWILQVVVFIVLVKFAFDFLNNTTRIASALEDIAKNMQHDTHESKKAKETEKA